MSGLTVYDDTQALIEASKQIYRLDHQNPDDSDDRVSIVLYRAPDGRFFIHVTDCGVHSKWYGEIGAINWYQESKSCDWIPN